MQLVQLVQQLLLGRTEEMSAPQLAAFVDGWTSALELLRRPAICLPSAPDEVREALAELALEIERAQRLVLARD